MLSKLENALPALFISVRKLVGSVLTSGLIFNFTQVKIKVGMPHRVNPTSMFKLPAFNIQHLNSNREDFSAFIFSFALNCRKD